MTNSISNTMRTGNPIADALLLSMIPIAINLIFTYWSRLQDYLMNYVSTLKIFRKKEPEQLAELSYRANIGTDYDFFISIKDYVQQFTEKKPPRYVDAAYAPVARKKEILFIPKGEYIFPYKGEKIWFFLGQETKNDKDGKIVSDIQVLLLKSHKLNTLKDFVKAALELNDEKCSRVIQPRFYQTTTGSKFTGQPLYTNKTFDSIFFDGKEKVIEELERFLRNPEFYQKRGIVHKATFLLHGKPGTGKTSFIKALSKYCNRHIVSINLASIHTDEDLCKVFQESISIDGNITTVPLKHRIFVLEDVDAAGDLVLSREFQKHPERKKHPAYKMMIKKNSKKNSKKDKKNDDDSDDCDDCEELDDIQYPTGPTLATLLNCLDGMLELDNTIVVMTTNHPEKLDPALIRPGRVNHNIHLTNMSRECIKQMLEYYFEEKIKHNDYNRIPDKLYTPAEVQVRVAGCENIEDAIRVLTTNEYDIPSD